MRVLLDATPAAHGPSGTAVYADRVAAALRDLGVTVEAVANPRRRPPGTGNTRHNVLADARWSQVDLRRRARGFDVVHHVLPALTLAGPRPQVVTVHDLAFEALPAAFDPRFRRYARLVHRFAARHAAAVIVPSEATARELHDRWGVSGAIVAPHGPGQELAVERGEPRHLLYVGDAEPRKDLPTLLAAYARYRSQARDPLPLVLAGRARSVDSGVRTVLEPDAATLAGLYAHAAALVHPSRHEGFGLTVREALAAGVPVIAADVPAVREVAGGAARLFPPGDVDALAASLHEPPPPPARDQNAPDWAASARAHLAAYEQARSTQRGRGRRMG